MGKTQLFEVPGRLPHGRQRKTGKKNVEEELALLNLQEEHSLDINKWRTVIDRLTNRGKKNLDSLLRAVFEGIFVDAKCVNYCTSLEIVHAKKF